jgi:hypothetical protein
MVGWDCIDYESGLFLALIPNTTILIGILAGPLQFNQWLAGIALTMKVVCFGSYRSTIAGLSKNNSKNKICKN